MLRTNKKFNNVTIIGRRWLQKTYGNTYHTVMIYVDGKYIGKSIKTYGYGEGFIQTAFEMLKNFRIFPMNWDYGDFMSYMINHREKFVITCADVARERDL